MQFISRVYYSFAYWFSLSLFLVVSFFVNIVCWFILWLPGAEQRVPRCRAVLQRLYACWGVVVRRLGVLDLKTPQRRARPSGQGEIWVMNHPTLLDASHLFKFTTNSTCIYKRSIGSNPFYGATAKLANYIPNVGGADLVRLACGALERGEDLIIFPEGTRTTHLDLDAFKSGFALIAKRSGAVINVMWLDGPDGFMTREASVWKPPSSTAHVSISQIGRVDPAGLRSVGAIVSAVKQRYFDR